MTNATAESFADLFHLAECDSEGLYWHADGSVSCAWLTHPMSAEHLSGQARHEIADQLGQAISNLITGSTLQIILRTVPNVDWALNNYLKTGGSSHAWIRQAEIAKVNAVREWTSGLGGIVRGNVTVKDVQCMMVLTIYQSNDATIQQIWQDVRDSMLKPVASEYGLPPLKTTKAHKRTQDTVHALASQIRTDRSAMEKAFVAIRLPHHRASQEMMIRFTRSLVDPKDGPTQPITVDPELYLPEMICQKRVEFLEGGRYVLCNGVYQSMLTCETYPEELFAGILSLNSHVFEDSQSLIDFLGDGTLTVSCKSVERIEALAWLDRRQLHTKGNASEQVEKEQAFTDVQAFKDWIKNQHRSAVDMSISVKVCGESQFLVDQKAKEFQSLAQKLQFALRIEDHDCKTIWCEHLPGGFNKSESDASQRVRRKRDIVFAACAPVYLSGRGTTSFAHLAFNQHYEPYAFDQFKHKRSFNTAALGESGSGKSNRIYDIVLDNLRIDTCRVYAIDYGGSFGTLTSLLDNDGCDAALSLSIKQPSNTFAGPAETTIPMLLTWLPGLALEPGENFKPAVKALVDAALRKAYEKDMRLAQPYAKVEDIAKEHPGYFPTNARKRFIINFLAPDAVKNVREMLKGDETIRPRFEVYFRIRIRGFMQEKARSMRAPRALNDIGEADRQYLAENYRYLEQDEQGPYVLSPVAEAEILTRRGWMIEVDQTSMVAEVQRFQDLRSLLRASASLIHDPVWLASQTATIRANLVDRFGADHKDLEKFLAQDLARLDPQAYFDATPGLVDLQGEIIFSDFIAQAKRMNEPLLNDFIGRLTPWYGSGTYADFFDRRGGIQLEKYRCVVWDFKPIWGADTAFIAAMLGSVMTRIQVYCDSITTMNERKIVVLDEFHEFKKRAPDLTVKFVDRVTLQARKNNYCMLLGAQKFEHIADPGVAGINLVDQIQHFWIGTQSPESISRLKERLGFNDDQCYVASQARMEPGRFSDFLLYIPASGTCEIVRSIQTSFEYWLKTTKSEERLLRQERISHYQRDHQKPLVEATVLAIKDLAKKYPRGKAAADLVEISA